MGDDEFGYMLADILTQNGVDSSGMRFDAHARTSLAFFSLKRDGEPEFLYYRNPSADMLLRPEQVDMKLIKKVSSSVSRKYVELQRSFYANIHINKKLYWDSKSSFLNINISLIHFLWVWL